VHVWNMNMVIVCDNVGWRTGWRWCICSDDKFEETLCILVVSRIILVHICMLYEWGVGLYRQWMFHDSMSDWVSTDRELDWMSHGSLSYRVSCNQITSFLTARTMSSATNLVWSQLSRPSMWRDVLFSSSASIGYRVMSCDTVFVC